MMASIPTYSIAGYPQCGYYVKAKNALTGMNVLFPNEVKLGEIKECT
jgi:hypothetical protein